MSVRTTASTTSWDWARAQLSGLPGGRGLNIAHEVVDRHVLGGRGDEQALRWLGRDGSRRTITYAELRSTSNRFANALGELGVRRGETVFLLLGRVPELYDAAIGTWKAGAVLSPLFAAFGPEPVRQRMALGDARVLVTTSALYRRRVLPIRDQLPGLAHVLVIDGDGDDVPTGTQALAPLLARCSDDFEIPPTDPSDPAIVHFTSGTTGTPKGAVHVHAAVIAHHATGTLAFGLQPHDVFWCTADPGWVTGTSYGVIAPLTHGVTVVVDQGELEADRWYRILEQEQVTVWYTSPTAVRMLMRAGEDVVRSHDLSQLRFAASVGEPLTPDAVRWSERVWGTPLHDTWWQTETGGIMIANLPGREVRPGSMGVPLPGVVATVLARDELGDVAIRDGHVVEVEDPQVGGHLALRPGWPSMFRSYLNDPERTEACFVDGWYVTGDIARRDRDGYYWFVARADDVIKSAGHLVGPFEIETVLLSHPDIVDAGVIGVPDAVAGETVKAFVSLRDGVEPTPDLARELIGYARSRLGAAVAPREIAFDPHLPHTRSGKIMRRLLKARELGEPEGDLSTLERT